MFDVGTGIVVAEAAAEGASLATLVDVVEQPVMQLIFLSLAGLLGWLARGKSQKSVDTLLELEESIQKLQPKAGEEISPIKQNQLGYVNVLMAKELSRRLIAMPSLWDYLGIIVCFIFFFPMTYLLLALGLISFNFAVFIILSLLVSFVVIGLSIDYQRWKKKRERATLAREMVKNQMNLDNADSAGGYGDLLNIEELIPIPDSPMGWGYFSEK